MEPEEILVARLEQANRRLLECPASNLSELEAAIAARDEAVRQIADPGPSCFSEAIAERLRRAFEDGHRIREKLAAVYGNADGELKRLERLKCGGVPVAPPSRIDVVG